MQFLATGIKGADHRIDLPDSLPGLLVRPAVLRILEATSEVALCAGLCRCHVTKGSRNVYVTHVNQLWMSGTSRNPLLDAQRRHTAAERVMGSWAPTW